MPEPEAVQFYSEGLPMAGLLYRPADQSPGERRPGVLLCHGFTGVKEMALPDVARRFAGAGYPALTFDYRYFGESGGEPRHRLLPLAQVRDIRNALTYFQTLDGVDPDRIALWGTSFGGANVIYTAAHDSRVACVIANVPVTNGPRWLRSIRTPESWYDLLDRVAADRIERVKTGQTEYVRPFDVLPPDRLTIPFIREHWAGVAKLPREITLESVDAILDDRPDDYVHQIAPRPLLLIACRRDTIAPTAEAEAAYEKAGDPKKLVLLPPDVMHWSAYIEPGLSIVVGSSLAWIREHLG